MTIKRGCRPSVKTAGWVKGVWARVGANQGKISAKPQLMLQKTSSLGRNVYEFCLLWMVLMMENSKNNTKIALCRFIRREDVNAFQAVFLKIPACQG